MVIRKIIPKILYRCGLYRTLKKKNHMSFAVINQHLGQIRRHLYIHFIISTLAAFSFIILTSCTGSIAQDGNSDGTYISGFEYSGKHLDISEDTENARATFWKPDGSIVFVTGRYTDNVAAYATQEPWQIHTAEFLQKTNVPGEFQHGLYIREDGIMMWVFDRTSIWEFSLEKPWDISSRSEGINHDLSHFALRGHDVDFKPDGSVLFIDDRNAGAVFEYSLATPWDVSSGNLTYTLDISDQQLEVRGIEFLKEGKLMVLMDTKRKEVLQYDLAEAYNISTATYSGAFDVSSQTGQGRGLSFSADETIMYVTGRDEQKIFQYEIRLEN